MPQSNEASYPVLREDLKESNIIFVHAALDEAGLTTSEFRIYAHIARRGLCWASHQTIANHCMMVPSTVKLALQTLEERNMISIEKRHGKTSNITLTKPSEWKPRTDLADNQLGDKRLPTQLINGYHLADNQLQSISPEVDPIEVNPVLIKGEKQKQPPFIVPKSLENSVEFLMAHGRWLQHLREKKKTPTPSTTKSQLKAMEAMGPERAIKAIDYSIANGWQGIFEPRPVTVVNGYGHKPVVKAVHKNPDGTIKPW